MCVCLWYRCVPERGRTSVPNAFTALLETAHSEGNGERESVSVCHIHTNTHNDTEVKIEKKLFLPLLPPSLCRPLSTPSSSSTDVAQHRLMRSAKRRGYEEGNLEKEEKKKRMEKKHSEIRQSFQALHTPLAACVQLVSIRFRFVPKVRSTSFCPFTTVVESTRG